MPTHAAEVSGRPDMPQLQVFKHKMLLREEVGRPTR
jgi:hypothetical protein